MPKSKKDTHNSSSKTLDDSLDQEHSKLNKKKVALMSKLDNFSQFFTQIRSMEPTESQLLEIEMRISALELNLLKDFGEVQLELEILNPDNFDVSETNSFECSYYAKVSEAKQFLCQKRQALVVQQPSSEVLAGINSRSGSKPGAKLPIIELPKFTGAYEQWLEFRDLFTSLVHNCDYLSPIDKFHYLRSSLEGAAAKCINSVDFTAENYDLAWIMLCDRFENKKLMVHNYIKSIFSIRNVDYNSPSAYRDLVDTLSKTLRCLQTLGVKTDFWDPLIIYLVTSKLDSDIIKEWEKQEFEQELPSLSELKTFLCNQADILETINMHKTKSRSSDSVQNKFKPKSFVASSGVYKKSKFACYYCQKPHYIFSCYAFKALSADQKMQKVVELKLCVNCLQTGHDVSSCKSGNCKHCKEKHHSLLHPPEKSAPTQVTTSSCHYSSNRQVLLATALVNIHDAFGRKHVIRALLDSGSMSNFVSRDIVKNLGLKQEKVNCSIVGIGRSESNINTSSNIHISSCQGNFVTDLYCLVIDDVTGYLPGTTFDPSSIMVPDNIQLADPRFYESQKVDLLLGANIFWELIGKNTIRFGKNKPVIQQTRLGWVISGALQAPGKKVVSCHFSRTSEIQAQLSKFWEIEELPPQSIFSSEEQQAENHFVATFKRNPNDGRFIVSIPLKEPISKLGDSREAARRQFFSLERRLASNPQYHDMYSSFMAEYEKLGHMSSFNPLDGQTTFYSPHHGVFREDSETTKLRVVFNGSSVSSSGYSYNSIQMVGPVVQEDLFSIILRFRQHNIVICADICKMYRQISVDEYYFPLQLIFWRKSPEEELKTFALKTVTYGTASAPFLATRCLKQLAIDHQVSNPRVSEIIGRDFYVDDLISGASSVEETKKICQQLIKILDSGCFTLRKWKSNSPQVLENLQVSNSSEGFQFGSPESTKILGLYWSPTSDYFSFKINLPEQKRVTKRVLLSEISKIFDVLGLISPIVVKAKILLQSLWSLQLSWDQDVPEDISKKWNLLRSEFLELDSLKFPRQIMCINPTLVEIHGFSDSSQAAYGACLYIRSIDSDQKVHVHLLTSKTRVAPLKSVSIPRLELCAALLLAQLFEKVTKSLTIAFNDYYMWSDSQVVLAWLRSSPHLLKTFVGNRVAQIQNLSDIQKWSYVPTDSNPADILSRGISTKNLKVSKLWYHGPKWLCESSEHWPNNHFCQNPILFSELPEINQKTQCFVQAYNEYFPFSRFSSLTRLQRVASYCFRFIGNCRVPKEQRKIGILTFEELNESLDMLIRLAQRESFPEEIHDFSKSSSVNRKSRLLSLNPFMDQNLIRVGGRLHHSSFSFGKKHPLVLSPKHHLTYLIFKAEHIKLLHCGPQMLLAHVRDKYWPISGKNLAKRIVRECIICFRFNPVTPIPLMGSLPKPRVSPNPPFFHTGVDYAGPFVIKDRKGRGFKTQKCYLCLFVCLSTKAVHLEIVTDLSTPAFLETFQRFISRRGKPSHVYSDNGSNFVGASNELKELGNFLASNCKTVQERLELVHSVNWRFIAAYSPHQGGLWEAGVKSAKHHIKRVISGTLLTFESFYTVITQIEGILNSRPLTPMTTDPNDLEVLTPAHFLIGRSLLSIPYADVQKSPQNRLTYFHQLERMKQQFWTRWSRDYISQLQQRSKWKLNQSSISVGSLVLVRDDNLPPNKWRLGRIIETHPGTDNIVRVVSVKTANGIIKRAVVKVCPLPIDTNDD